jgi:hypothetical protein
MGRNHLLPTLFWLVTASLAGAQENPGEKKANAAVIELLEDETAFLIDHLDNHRAPDASVADRSERGAFAGESCLIVTAFQRFNSRLPGWSFIITKVPEPGQYRYLRFAWKRTEAPGIMLQIHAKPNAWHRYYAGTLSEQTMSWGAMTRVENSAPRKWELVTRDLFADFGPMTITGIGFSALDGPGVAYYDHIYLGRTIEDLDRVTAAKKNRVTEPEAAPEPVPDVSPRRPWLFWAIVGLVSISLVGFLCLTFVMWLRKSKAGEKETLDNPGGKPSPRKSASAKTGKSHPKSPET